MAMTEVTGDVAARESEAMVVAACLFHGFSDPSRLAILQHLALGEHRVVDLTGHLGLAQSTVSKHLACLRDCGLVESRPQGRASVFSLTHPEATLAVLASAEKLLALTGDAVALCPVYGVDGSAVHPTGAAAQAATTASGAAS
ncbi:metalloregulator ArsR/SmtB family transcription factor [Promicromonospora sp. NPDC050262]|uniref:ArsR/SmtB family transcription factor n=1 Tax=Promicromonospora sp. NPDC050262 TaxID=3155036 RepID=UPI0033D56791